jgi:hypothetical protein
MTNRKMRTVKRYMKAKRHTSKENREMFVGLLKQKY